MVVRGQGGLKTGAEPETWLAVEMGLKHEDSVIQELRKGLEKARSGQVASVVE
jgi:hypothetical protein